MPGTGSVVMYMVTHRYRYNVPMMKKNRRPTIDLGVERAREDLKQGEKISQIE